jgi:hypothetical protein
MNKELLCKDCAHAILPAWHRRLLFGIDGTLCSKDYVQPKFNPVTGKSRPGYYTFAGATRMDTRICGPEAISWMPRKKEDLFKLIRNSER